MVSGSTLHRRHGAQTGLAPIWRARKRSKIIKSLGFVRNLA
jgi:hypothetical protein